MRRRETLLSRGRTRRRGRRLPRWRRGGRPAWCGGTCWWWPGPTWRRSCPHSSLPRSHPPQLHCADDAPYTKFRDGLWTMKAGRSSGLVGPHNSTDFSLIVPHLVRTCPGKERGCQQDPTPAQQHSNLRRISMSACSERQRLVFWWDGGVVDWRAGRLVGW